MNIFIKLCCLTLSSILLSACMKDDTWQDTDPFSQYHRNPSSGGGPNGGNASSSDTSGDLLASFDISTDLTPLVEPDETIPSDKDAEDYDDYLEHSSFTSKITINYSGTEAKVDGDVNGVKVEQNGSHVTITSTSKGVEYVLSGTTSDGSVKIYSSNKFKLTLDQVNITNPTGAAINIQSKKRVFVVNQDNTTNYLTDGTSYNKVENEDMKGCLFSEGQLIFSGKGRLVVNGNYKHGICSDDYIVIRKGTDINIQTQVGNGIKVNDYLTINGGILNINVKGNAAKGLSSDGHMEINGGRTMILTSGEAVYEDDDVSGAAGIKCDSIFVMNGGSLGIKSTGDGGKGISCDNDITINDGEIKVLTTGKQYIYNKLDTSAKGIKSDANITINGGNIMVRTTGDEGSEGIESKNILTINGGTTGVSAYDDAFNASKSLNITGGNIYAYSSGNDGIDSNGTINISGGTVVTVGTSTPEAGIDCDQNTFTITGGTLIGIGGTTSTPTSSQCKQPCIIYSGNCASGAYLSLNDSKGKSIMAYKIPRSYNQITILMSSASLTKGDTYTLSSGGKLSGGTEFYGLYTGATYSDGSTLANLSLSNMVTTYGNTANGMGGGGPRW